MSMPNFPIDAQSWGEFEFLRIVPAYVDRERTQQRVSADGRPKWKVELLLIPHDEDQSSSTISVTYTGPKLDLPRNVPVFPTDMTGGTFHDKLFITISGLTEADQTTTAVYGIEE